MKNILMTGCLCLLVAESSVAQLTTNSSPASVSSDTSYGLFGWLDHRSGYGQGVFPEPFLVDDSDLEQGEARMDWLHTRDGSATSDMGTAEIEKGFGMMTLEVEVPYERDHDVGENLNGFDNIDLGARYPFYQYVSQSGFVDSTFGAGVEVGIPTESSISKNTELVPKVFDDLKIGNFTTQAIFGYSKLFGPGEEGGQETFEYGLVFGYTLEHRMLPIPDVLQTIPFMEVIGETPLNKDDGGDNNLLGNAGFRFNLKSIGRIQPRPGVGFVFPMNNAARQDTHWGVITSLVFEF